MGPRGVQGNLVLVTDGWDNASGRFAVSLPGQAPPPSGRVDLVTYMLPPQSALTLRVIGIGSGMERDKGVDGARIQELLNQMTRRAQELGLPAAFSFQEVTTGSALFVQMVNAFLDVGYEDDRPIEDLHPEELAQHAANAARALKEPQQHATVSRLRPGTPAPSEMYTEAPDLEVDVLASASGVAGPSNLKERYGPLGEIVEAYLAGQFDAALALIQRSGGVLPPVTRLYWEARVQFARRRSSSRRGPSFRRGTRSKSSRPLPRPASCAASRSSRLGCRTTRRRRRSCGSSTPRNSACPARSPRSARASATCS